jgi:hypothetical protein
MNELRVAAAAQMPATVVDTKIFGVSGARELEVGVALDRYCVGRTLTNHYRCSLVSAPGREERFQYCEI